MLTFVVAATPVTPVYETARTMFEPAGPVGPVAPVFVAEPGNPVGPVGPVFPVGPAPRRVARIQNAFDVDRPENTVPEVCLALHEIKSVVPFIDTTAATENSGSLTEPGLSSPYAIKPAEVGGRVLPADKVSFLNRARQQREPSV